MYVPLSYHILLNRFISLQTQTRRRRGSVFIQISAFPFFPRPLFPPFNFPVTGNIRNKREGVDIRTIGMNTPSQQFNVRLTTVPCNLINKVSRTTHCVYNYNMYLRTSPVHTVVWRHEYSPVQYCTVLYSPNSYREHAAGAVFYMQDVPNVQHSDLDVCAAANCTLPNKVQYMHMYVQYREYLIHVC